VQATASLLAVVMLVERAVSRVSQIPLHAMRY
jgi:hypothetical protein